MARATAWWKPLKLKVTKHNVLAVACASMLLLSALPPAQASARNKGPQSTRYAQNEAGANRQSSDKQKAKRSSRSSDAQSSGATNAQHDDRKKSQPTPRGSDSPSEAPTVSRSEAAAIAERATGGRVLSIRESGRYWQVKVLVDGKRVRIISVDMRSGRVR